MTGHLYSPLAPITHERLVQPGVRHGFFTRRGGVSTGIHAGLNTGIGSHDDPQAVRENRRRIAEVMGGTPADFAACYQVHSAIAHRADAPWGDHRPEGDAVVSAAPGVICAVLTADCAPVLFLDRRSGVVAATHAGWKGALGGVLEATLGLMRTMGARPEDTVAVVGPAIGPASYEVDEAFQARFLDTARGSDRFFTPATRPDRRMFDLPGFVLWRLERAGVGETAWTGHDTRTDETLFYSNRRAHLNGEPDFGRMMSVIALKA